MALDVLFAGIDSPGEKQGGTGKGVCPLGRPGLVRSLAATSWVGFTDLPKAPRKCNI